MKMTGVEKSYMIPLFVSKRTISLHFQMAWQHCIFFVGYLAFQGCANCAHFRTRKAAGEILVFHTDLRPSYQDFQLNCCNKLPITVAALFSQLMPDAECVTLAVSCISLLYCFFIPIPCPSSPLHVFATWASLPGLEVWNQALAALHVSWDYSGLSQPPCTLSMYSISSVMAGVHIIQQNNLTLFIFKTVSC